MVDQSGVTLVRQALAEDLAGYGDITSHVTVPADLLGEAEIVARESLVVCGLDLAELVLREVDDRASFARVANEGTALSPGAVVARIEGPVRSILSAERTMLNFLSHLSGVATESRRFAQAVVGMQVRVVDTRKTTPGLRVWEKRAVVYGGCSNHRFGLFDMVLIKNNHLVAAGGVAEALRRAREACPHSLKIEVEVENVEDLREALAHGADVVMLDNQTPETLRELVLVARSLNPTVLLEASGGVTLENVREVAAAGVDIISTSAITMGAPAANLSLRLRARV